MSFDVTQADIDATLAVVDATTQDHSFGDRQFPGLYNDLNWIWAMVDTEDGKRYELIRCFGKSGTFDYTLHECLPDIWAYPRHVRIPGETDLYWGPIIWLPDGETHCLFPANLALAAKHQLTLNLGPDGYTWKDDDVIDVVLTPVPGNVTVIDVPGRPDPVGYTSSGCSVSGTIEGSKIVGGYGGLDRMYCLPEISCQTSKIANLEHYWFVWKAEFEDGTWETGNCMLGAGGYATATFHRQGEDPVIATNADVRSVVEWEDRDDVGRPKSASLTFGGRTFDFTGTHNAAACAAALGIAWLHGTVQERGARVPTRSWSTMESIQRDWTPAESHEADRATPRVGEA